MTLLVAAESASTSPISASGKREGREGEVKSGVSDGSGWPLADLRYEIAERDTNRRKEKCKRTEAEKTLTTIPFLQNVAINDWHSVLPLTTHVRPSWTLLTSEQLLLLVTALKLLKGRWLVWFLNLILYYESVSAKQAREDKS